MHQVVGSRRAPAAGGSRTFGACVALAMCIVGSACSPTPGPTAPVPPPPASAPADAVAGLAGPSTSTVPPTASPPPSRTPAPPALVPPPSGSVPRRTGEAPAPSGNAQAAAIVDGATGALLFGGDEHRQLPPASLVKIAAAVLAIEAGDLDRKVEVDVDAWEMEVESDSSVMGLQRGDHFTMRDLLYGMLLPSGNDAAVAIAHEVAGSEQGFVTRLNALAGKLGLRDTRFTDVDGLGHQGQYSSAYDLALLGRYAMTLVPFREVVATEHWIAHGDRDLELWNTNPLLNYTDGVDGVKTGFTDEAGRTFVASATRNGHRIFVVLLNDPNRALDAIALIEWAFANFVWQD